MNAVIFLLLLIIIAGIFGIIYIIYYNQMQYLKTKIEQSLNKINESIRDKYDIINRASLIIKETLEEKKDYLKEYVALKEKNLNNFEMDRKLAEAFQLIKTLTNDNKSLETNKNMKEILNDLKENEEKLTAAKSYFNKNTTDLNKYIRKIPSNIVAKIHHFEISPFFDGNQNKIDFKL